MEEFTTCEQITDSLGNNCFKTLKVDNLEDCYCKNNPDTVFNLQEYDNNHSCKNCNDKYSNSSENKLYNSVNELIATVHVTADVIEYKTKEINNLYDEFKKKLENYSSITNLINNDNYLISVEESNINKLETTIMANEIDYSNYLKENDSYNTQLQNENYKINKF